MQALPNLPAQGEGTSLFGATLFCKINSGATGRMFARLMLNVRTEIRASLSTAVRNHCPWLRVK